MNSRRSASAAGLAAVSTLVVAVVAGPPAAATPWCASDSLSLTTSTFPPPDPASQSYIALVLTNESEQPCALQGYPDVQLIGAEDPMFGPIYVVPRQAGDPQPLTLAPADSARSILTYLPGPPDGWIPDTIVVRPPHTSTRLETPWIIPGTSVVRQDAATHPGTYIGPLQPND